MKYQPTVTIAGRAIPSTWDEQTSTLVAVTPMTVNWGSSAWLDDSPPATLQVSLADRVGDYATSNALNGEEIIVSVPLSTGSILNVFRGLISDVAVEIRHRKSTISGADERYYLIRITAEDHQATADQAKGYAPATTIDNSAIDDESGNIVSWVAGDRVWPGQAAATRQDTLGKMMVVLGAADSVSYPLPIPEQTGNFFHIHSRDPEISPWDMYKYVAKTWPLARPFYDAGSHIMSYVAPNWAPAVGLARTPATVIHAWRGAANASASTETNTVTGAVRVNYATDASKVVATGGAYFPPDQTWKGRVWRSVVSGSRGWPARFNLNGYQIASGALISGSLLIANPNDFEVDYEVDIGDEGVIVGNLAPGEERIVGTSARPVADGVYQFFDLASSGTAPLLFREPVVEVGVGSAGPYFDGSTAGVGGGLQLTFTKYTGQYAWQDQYPIYQVDATKLEYADDPVVTSTVSQAIDQIVVTSSWLTNITQGQAVHVGRTIFTDKRPVGRRPANRKSRKTLQWDTDLQGSNFSGYSNALIDIAPRIATTLAFLNDKFATPVFKYRFREGTEGLSAGLENYLMRMYEQRITYAFPGAEFNALPNVGPTFQIVGGTHSWDAERGWEATFNTAPVAGLDTDPLTIDQLFSGSTITLSEISLSFDDLGLPSKGLTT